MSTRLKPLFHIVKGVWDERGWSLFFMIVDMVTGTLTTEAKLLITVGPG
jgi:hypothetical protein